MQAPQQPAALAAYWPAPAGAGDRPTPAYDSQGSPPPMHTGAEVRVMDGVRLGEALADTVVDAVREPLMDALTEGVGGGGAAATYVDALLGAKPMVLALAAVVALMAKQLPAPVPLAALATKTKAAQPAAVRLAQTPQQPAGLAAGRPAPAGVSAADTPRPAYDSQAPLPMMHTGADVRVTDGDTVDEPETEADAVAATDADTEREAATLGETDAEGETVAVNEGGAAGATYVELALATKPTAAGPPASVALLML